MRMWGTLGAALWLVVPAPQAQAQVLGRASSSVHGTGSSSSRGQGEVGSPPAAGGRSTSGRGSESRGSVSYDSEASPTVGSGSALKCAPDRSVLDCVRDSWSAAGLANVGGVLFFWATVLGDYPYASGSGGYAVPLRDHTDRAREWRTAFRLEFEGGYVLAGAGRVAAAARVQLPFYVDLATRYALFVETGDAEVSAFTLGRVDLELRLLDTNGMQLRVGGGVRHAHDALGSALGGGIGIALDLFLVQPLIVSLSADVGGVGGALLVGLRASLGLIVDRTEIYVGYVYDALFGVQVADLGAVTLGVRAWL